MLTEQEELATKKDLKKLENALTVKIDGNGEKIDANAAKIDQVEKNLTAKIDANAAKIDANAAKIEANGKKIEANAAKIEANGRKIDANAEKIEANGKKIDTNTSTIDRLITIVLENRERMATKEDISDINVRLDQLISTLDGLTRSFSVLEQERIVTNQRLDRIEARLA